ncbi:MAG: hypothetical protein WC061_09890, partial [Melioribacteraceae bacterium]
MQKNFLLRLFLTASILIAVSAFLNAQEKKLGDERDGSRSKPIHQIKLLDENNKIILEEDNPQSPFSAKYTCGDCHSYDIIKNGYHFNKPLGKSSFDRNGEPWIYVDLKKLTVLPVSYRGWNGTFSPEKLNISPFQFLKLFGTHFTGGTISEDESLEKPENFFRWEISGKLPVNCLLCHDASEKFNSAEYSLNILRQNFKWAAAAGSDIAVVTGSAKEMPDNFDIYNRNTFADVDLRTYSPPNIIYNKSVFNSNKVFFNIKRQVPNDRCYYCHSSVNVSKRENKFIQSAEDVHLKSGMICVDCHTNGLNHDMIRGFENESMMKNDPARSSFTCEGCHLGNEKESVPTGGRLGAPVPKHLGLPAVHLDKLACTTCHSGIWPDGNTNYVKTSRAHKLGVPGINKSANLFPHIQAPLFVRNEMGKIEPHRLLWPSYWAKLKNNEIKPIPVNDFSDSLSVILRTDSLKTYDIYPAIGKPELIRALTFLKPMAGKNEKIIFVTGENYIELRDNAELKVSNHPYIKPYTWAIAHDVRPASQSLGSKSCQDCHSWNSDFFFGDAAIETPYSPVNSRMSSSSLAETGALYHKLFSLSFFFRSI